MRWVRLDGAESSQREALRHSRSGDWQTTQMIVRNAAEVLKDEAGDDPELLARLHELLQFDRDLAHGPWQP